MRAIPEALASHIAGGVTTLCRCWRLTRRDGAVLGFTDHDRDLTFRRRDPCRLTAALPRARRRASWVWRSPPARSAAPSPGRVSPRRILPRASMTTPISPAIWSTGPIPVPAAAAGYRQRSARSAVPTTALLPNCAAHCTATIRSRGAVYTDACTADLGDACCKVDLASRTVEAPVSGTDGRLALTIDHPALDTPGAFTAGRVRILSGANAGAVADDPAAGSGRSAAVGAVAAALMTAMWCASFPAATNLRDLSGQIRQHLNFRGFPHIPTPDFILTYARPGEGGHDGGLLDP
jgi:hypothetical protein